MGGRGSLASDKKKKKNSRGGGEEKGGLKPEKFQRKVLCFRFLSSVICELLELFSSLLVNGAYLNCLKY